MVSNNGQCVCMSADVFMHICVYECIYTAIDTHTYIFIYRYTSTHIYSSAHRFEFTAQFKQG